MTFMEKLKHSSQVNRSLVCVGLDPERTKLPECVREKEHALFEFNRAIIDATADWVCAYKPQAAYYAAISVPPRRCTRRRHSSATTPTP